MAYEKKNGDIAVFKNKSDNTKAPAWKGDAMINGITYEVALWEKGGNGTMLAGNIKIAGEKKPYAQAPVAAAKPAQPESIADEIPFMLHQADNVF